MRDADYQIVFSKRDYGIYLKDGVPDEKLYILSHPLSRESREFFEKVYFNKLKKYEKNEKSLILLMPTETDLGVDKNNRLIVSREDREKNYLEIVKLINNVIPDWKIYIKPHPDTKNFEKIRENFKLISNNIEVVNPKELIDKYIQIGNVIIGLPLSASTALFTAFLQCPGKPIISLDFFHELLGDTYKNFEGIEYIDTIKDFVSILEKIKNNCYQKIIQIKKRPKEDKEFFSTVEMIEFLFNNKEKK
jgi:hypothetical protein